MHCAPFEARPVEARTLRESPTTRRSSSISTALRLWLETSILLSNPRRPQHLDESLFEIQIHHFAHRSADRGEIVLHAGRPSANQPLLDIAIAFARQQREWRAPERVGSSNNAQTFDTVLELLHRQLGDQSAAVQQTHPVTDALQLVNEVTGDEHRCFLVRHIFKDGGENVAPHDRIETIRRLVQNEQLGPLREREEHEQLSRLAFGKRAHAPLADERELLKELVRPALIPRK